MSLFSANRLTVVGPKADLEGFDPDSEWSPEPSFCELELMEISPARCCWQFKCQQPPLALLKQNSLDRPSLTFLLEYDQEDKRVKGLVKARGGKLRHFRVTY
jgi:hypothetical protein